MKKYSYFVFQKKEKNFVKIEISGIEVFRLNNYIEKLSGIKKYKSYKNDFSKIRLCFFSSNYSKLKRYIIFNKTIGPNYVQ